MRYSGYPPKYFGNSPLALASAKISSASVIEVKLLMFSRLENDLGCLKILIGLGNLI
jgi:hypothetical protein